MFARDMGSLRTPTRYECQTNSLRTPIRYECETNLARIDADAYGSCVRGRRRRNPRRGGRADSANLGHRPRAGHGATETTLRSVRSQGGAGHGAARVTGWRSSGRGAVEALGGADALDLLSAEALLLMVQTRAGAHQAARGFVRSGRTIGAWQNDAASQSPTPSA